jgi:hypothetical protein
MEFLWLRDLTPAEQIRILSEVRAMLRKDRNWGLRAAISTTLRKEGWWYCRIGGRREKELTLKVGKNAGLKISQAREDWDVFVQDVTLVLGAIDQTIECLENL